MKIKLAVLLPMALMLLITKDTFGKVKLYEKPSALSQHSSAVHWIENSLSPEYILAQGRKTFKIEELMSHFGIPGVGIVFVDKGEIAWQTHYGLANVETGKKVNENTVFAGASLSKPLAALATLKLVEAGDLDLDTNVNKYLKNWQIKQNDFVNETPVTLRHLLSHTAGIRNDLWQNYEVDETMPSVTTLLAGKPPSREPEAEVIFTPGSRARYSNTGYSIIQKILEDTAKQPFESILAQSVLEASDMQSTSFKQPIPQSLLSNRATGYSDNLQPFPYKLFPYKAAGGVWTTPVDIAKFIVTLFEDYDGAENIVSSSMVEQIFLPDASRLGGFAKLYNAEGADLIFRHYGTNQGFSSYVVGSFNKQQSAIIMTNGSMEFQFLDFIARAFSEYYGWELLSPSILEIVNTPLTDVQELSGPYASNGKQLNVLLNKDKLIVVNETSHTETVLTQVGEGTFFDSNNYTLYEFLRPRDKPNGAVKWLRITSPLAAQEYIEKQ